MTFYLVLFLPFICSNIDSVRRKKSSLQLLPDRNAKCQYALENAHGMPLDKRLEVQNIMTDQIMTASSMGQTYNNQTTKMA